MYVEFESEMQQISEQVFQHAVSKSQLSEFELLGDEDDSLFSGNSNVSDFRSKSMSAHMSFDKPVSSQMFSTMP
jgi:hypothetical protein